MLEEQLKEDPKGLLQEVEQKLTQALSPEEKAELLQLKIACLSLLKRKNECFACVLELLELGLELKNDELAGLYKKVAEQLLADENIRPDDTALIQRWEEISPQLPESSLTESASESNQQNAHQMLEQKLRENPESCLRDIDEHLAQSPSPKEKSELLQLKTVCLSLLKRKNECFACALELLELGLELKNDELVGFYKNVAEQLLVDENTRPDDTALIQRWEKISPRLPEFPSTESKSNQ